VLLNSTITAYVLVTAHSVLRFGPFPCILDLHFPWHESYKRDYNDFLESLPETYASWDKQNGSKPKYKTTQTVAV